MSDTNISTQIGVRLSFEMRDALVALAKAQRRSVGFIVRDFIEEGLRREAEAKKRKPKRPHE